MQILVTGAAGYIGSILTNDLLNDGHRVLAIDSFSKGKTSLFSCCSHRKFKFFQGDVRDSAVMGPLVKQSDLIIALAALVSPQACIGRQDQAWDINTQSIKMLTELRSKTQPLLFMSTNIGYGTKERKAIYTEDDPLQPNSIYGLSKVAAEHIVALKDGFVIYRPASAFGYSPSMQDHLLLNYYCSKAINDNELSIYDANFERNFIHVRDISNCIRFTIGRYDSMKNNIYNIGISNENPTKLALALRIKNYIKDLNINCHTDITDQDARNYRISNNKIETAGFRCKFTIDDGIQELINYYIMCQMIR